MRVHGAICTLAFLEANILMILVIMISLMIRSVFCYDGDDDDNVNTHLGNEPSDKGRKGRIAALRNEFIRYKRDL